MPYNFVADSLQTKKLLADFLHTLKCDFRWKSAILCFWAPLRDLGTTYNDHLRLIGMRIVDFLLVLIGLFLLGVTAEALRANIGPKSAISLQQGPINPKFQVEWVAPTNHFFLRKLD